MNSKFNKKFSFVKKHIPELFAMFIVSVLLGYQSTLVGYLVNETVLLDKLYMAVFNWSAIQTGFLFSVFGYVANKKDGFLTAINKTKAKRKFDFSIKRAIFVGFVVTILSMPMMVLSFSPTEFGLGYIFLSAWVGLFIWEFILFCLVAYDFTIVIGTPDNREKLAH